MTPAGGQEHRERLRRGAGWFLDRLGRGEVESRSRIGREDEGFFCSPDPGGGALADIAEAVVGALGDPGIVLEIGQYQFELNYPALELSWDALGSWGAFQRAKLRALAEGARPLGAAPLLVAVPPRLGPADLDPARLVPSPRYDRLKDDWDRRIDARRRRGEPDPRVAGFSPSGIGYAAAIAACQLHMELPADLEGATRQWNLTHLLTPIALAAGVAAPFWMGGAGEAMDHRPPVWIKFDDMDRGRIFYGPGWVDSIVEVIEHYSGLPPFRLGDEEPADDFAYYQVHQKSLWPFVRLVLEPDHWRLENRAFSTAPIEDAALIAAFYFGLIAGGMRSPTLEGFRGRISFAATERNFHEAYLKGTEARFAWLDGATVSASELILGPGLDLATLGWEAYSFPADAIAALRAEITTLAGPRGTFALRLIRRLEGLRGPSMEDRLRALTDRLLEDQARQLDA